MNNEIKFDLKQIKLFYYSFRYSRYFPIIVPSAMLFISVLLIWLFIFPLLQNWFSIKNEIQATNEKIQSIHQNVLALENVDKTKIDTEVAFTSKVLPPDKDFVGIMSAITRAATESQVAVRDYSFSLGELKKLNQSERDIAGSITINLKLNLEASTSNVESFVRNVENSLPLAEIKDLSITPDSSQVSVAFYVKPTSSFTIRDSQPLSILTEKDTALLQKLNAWDR